jgi:site-specific recombinase XerC
MILLPNGCECNEPKVSPSNWESPKAPLKKNWYIYYRYYDPMEKAKYPKGKLRIIKGMNEAKTVSERQEIVKALIHLELGELKTLGFNPILEKHVAPLNTLHSINPDTPLIQALQGALSKAKFGERTYADIKSVLKYLEKAALLLRLDYLAVKDTRPSHLLLLLEQCGKIKDNWSANTYNAYLKYLSILFGQLLQHQAVEFNPARDLKKKKNTKKLREILSLEECLQIDTFTKSYDEALWRFIHIFFHSGSRTTEILRVQGEHVSLKKQKVKYLVLKGQQHEWVERTIKDIALPFWQKALENCGSKDYVFSVGLKPGEKAIRAEQISRRWRTHLKKKLGIKCDFYSLKHLNTDQTAALHDLRTASAHNSHKSTKTTLAYAVNEKERVHQKIKEVGNCFGS